MIDDVAQSETVDEPVWIVDDEPAFVRAIVRQLRSLGYHDVFGHSSAKGALESLDSGAAPGAILLDLNMPEIDGIQFLRSLANRKFGGALVLMSGEDQRVLQTADRLAVGHELHVLGTLAKPFGTRELGQTLGRHRGARRARHKSTRPPRSVEQLSTAITEGQLFNAYQPKVDLRSGKLVGVESLVRWQHPSDGVVYPDQFVGVAEQHGLIGRLTESVLRNALKDRAAWASELGDVHVAVNVSMDNLTEPSFADHVFERLQAAHAPPGSVTLEVTESRFAGNPLAALDILARLRLRRVSVSIDDFGTGFSSLAQLRDLPFDELKIDRSFVHGASSSDANRAIVEASIGIARKIGLRVVAEGIEDLVDWRLLAELGCDYAQGYFIGRPMPAAELARWLPDWSRRASELVVTSAG